MFPRSRALLAFFVGLFVLNLLISFLTGAPPDRPRVPYQPFFLEQVEARNVEAITSREDSIEGELKQATTYDPPGDDKPVEVERFVGRRFRRSSIGPGSTKLVTDRDVVINARAPDAGRGFLLSLLLGLAPAIVLVGFFIWLSRRGAGRGGVLGGFGRSTARRAERGGQQRVTFDDVAGIDEAEQELVEIVDFLKKPERYSRLGARIPRGVLLYGPPGTGKTLLARAVAGEAEAAFFSLSASEFVEAIVGIGASRVRDLFKQAKESAPAIVFIDELDAIGRSRSGGASGISGGHDEREQTLNQILTEMDGFEPGTNVIVLAATNRPEILDPALLRPGRFDRRIAVQPPDKNGRAKILQIHTRSVPLAPDVDLEQIAAATPGATGADLALIVNEAALFAARRDHAAVEQRDFTDAIEKIILGAERQIVMTDADRDAHRLPRVRARARRDAHARRRPRAEDLDHPPRAGTRRHALDAGDRPVRLLAGRARREDQSGARRPRGRAGRVWRHHDRRRVGHPEPDEDRTRDGRSLGHEREPRPARDHGRAPKQFFLAGSSPPRPRHWSTSDRERSDRRSGGVKIGILLRARRLDTAHDSWSAAPRPRPMPTGSAESRGLRSRPKTKLTTTSS